MAPTPTTDGLRKALAKLAEIHAALLAEAETVAPMLAASMRSGFAQVTPKLADAEADVAFLEDSANRLADVDLDLMSELDGGVPFGFEPAP
jgi:hypothetical protein